MSAVSSRMKRQNRSAKVLHLERNSNWDKIGFEKTDNGETKRYSGKNSAVVVMLRIDSFAWESVEPSLFNLEHPVFI